MKNTVTKIRKRLSRLKPKTLHKDYLGSPQNSQITIDLSSLVNAVFCYDDASIENCLLHCDKCIIDRSSETFRLSGDYYDFPF